MISEELQDVFTDKKEPNNFDGLSLEEFKQLEIDFLLLKKKVMEGAELSLEEQRLVIKYNRANREYKFVLASSKKETTKQLKGRKLSRSKLIVLLERELSGDVLSEKEVLDKEHSLLVYEPKILKGKELKELYKKILEDRPLNEVEKRDKELIGL